MSTMRSASGAEARADSLLGAAAGSSDDHAEDSISKNSGACACAAHARADAAARTHRRARSRTPRAAARAGSRRSASVRAGQRVELRDDSLKLHDDRGCRLWRRHRLRRGRFGGNVDQKGVSNRPGRYARSCARRACHPAHASMIFLSPPKLRCPQPLLQGGPQPRIRLLRRSLQPRRQRRRVPAACSQGLYSTRGRGVPHPSIGRRHERCFVRCSRYGPRPRVGRVPGGGFPRLRAVPPAGE